VASPARSASPPAALSAAPTFSDCSTSVIGFFAVQAPMPTVSAAWIAAHTVIARHQRVARNTNASGTVTVYLNSAAESRIPHSQSWSRFIADKAMTKNMSENIVCCPQAMLTRQGVEQRKRHATTTNKNPRFRGCPSGRPSASSPRGALPVAHGCGEKTQEPDEQQKDTPEDEVGNSPERVGQGVREEPVGQDERDRARRLRHVESAAVEEILVGGFRRAERAPQTPSGNRHT